MRGEKMSKSLGNVVRVPEALERASSEAIRLHLLMTHYRQPADFSEESLAEADQTLDRAYRALEKAQKDVGLPYAHEPDRELVAALLDDLNTPLAITRLHSLVTDLNRAVGKSANLETHRQHCYSSAGYYGSVLE